jgi:hypothetical protein
MFVRDCISNRVADLCNALMTRDNPKDTFELEEVVLSCMQFVACELDRNSHEAASKSVFLAAREVRIALDIARRMDHAHIYGNVVPFSRKRERL